MKKSDSRDNKSKTQHRHKHHKYSRRPDNYNNNNSTSDSIEQQLLLQREKRRIASLINETLPCTSPSPQGPSAALLKSGYLYNPQADRFYRPTKEANCEYSSRAVTVQLAHDPQSIDQIDTVNVVKNIWLNRLGNLSTLRSSMGRPSFLALQVSRSRVAPVDTCGLTGDCVGAAGQLCADHHPLLGLAAVARDRLLVSASSFRGSFVLPACSQHARPGGRIRSVRWSPHCSEGQYRLATIVTHPTDLSIVQVMNYCPTSGHQSFTGVFTGSKTMDSAAMTWSRSSEDVILLGTSDGAVLPISLSSPSPHPHTNKRRPDSPVMTIDQSPHCSHEILSGHRNGRIHSTDIRVSVSGREVGNMPFCISHLYALSRSSCILAQDVTGKMRLFDVRYPKRELFRVLEDVDERTLKFGAFWVSETEDYALTSAVNSEISLQILSINGISRDIKCDAINEQLLLHSKDLKIVPNFNSLFHTNADYNYHKFRDTWFVYKYDRDQPFFFAVS